MRADFNADCPVCNWPIVVGQNIVPRKSGWIHQGCAKGGDDQ